jgi:hypothetical protein
LLRRLRQYGRPPSQRELAQLGQAANFATCVSKEGVLDTAQLHADWADKLARTLGVPLASVAPSVWHADAKEEDMRPRDADTRGMVTPQPQERRAAQEEKSTWTRAELVKYLGRVLPRTGRDPAQMATLLENLADRALRSEFEPVLCLEAPDAAEAPPVCCAPTGAPCTGGTAASVMPPARSWASRTAWPRRPAPRAHRA